MTLCITIGTRPEIIKMAPLIWECEERDLNYFILHTGQHYSSNMDEVFFRSLNLPEPAYNLHAGSASHAEQTAKILTEAEKILQKDGPDIILVQGDTNSTLAVSLVAAKLHIPVAHVEAGLRCYDRSMPEEINRKLTDHLADYLFAPTETAAKNLKKEGIDSSKIFITGNTIVDVIYKVLENAESVEQFSRSPVTNNQQLTTRNYFLLTLHRQENVDNKKRLRLIFKGLGIVYSDYHLPILYPIHPRTKKRISEFNIKVPHGIRLIAPLGYFEFLELERNAKLVFTDSGGVQEETCILHTPCVTLRENTERPETLEVNANILSGSDPNRISQSAKLMIHSKNSWKNPFGDGNAAEKIIRILCSSCRGSSPRGG